MEDAHDKKKTSVKGHIRANMTNKEYWVLGCTPKTVPVCDSSLQRIARALAKRVAPLFTTSQDEAWVQLTSPRSGGLDLRPIPRENLTWLVWRAVDKEVSSRRARRGDQGAAEELGAEAEAALLQVVEHYARPQPAWPRVVYPPNPCPASVTRCIASLCGTTHVLNLNPVTGCLPHLPWEVSAEGEVADYSWAGSVPDEATLTNSDNWRGKSLLIISDKPTPNFAFVRGRGRTARTKCKLA